MLSNSGKVLRGKWLKNNRRANIKLKNTFEHFLGFASNFNFNLMECVESRRQLPK